MKFLTICDYYIQLIHPEWIMTKFMNTDMFYVTTQLYNTDRYVCIHKDPRVIINTIRYV